VELQSTPHPLDRRDRWLARSRQVATAGDSLRPLAASMMASGVLRMATGKSAASAAGKVLPDPKATKPKKAAAGSALAQAPKGGGKK
jgi:hypothetical protein